MDEAPVKDGSAAAVTVDMVTPALIHRADGVISCGKRMGCKDCLGRTGATLEEVVATFMVDGKMEIHAEITDVQ